MIWRGVDGGAQKQEEDRLSVLKKVRGGDLWQGWFSSELFWDRVTDEDDIPLYGEVAPKLGRVCSSACHQSC